jgi:succinate dehydrogenase / fumarate reductase, iron-sulfur subunit
MRFTIHVWRQRNSAAPGAFVRYEAHDASPEMSLLEVLDGINEELTGKGEEPIAFDHDCREGICGMCGFMINGVAHGPARGTTTCQLHMRHFDDDDVLWLEPWRARAFPVIRDLVVDRGSFDRIVAAGGFISVATGNAPDANAILIPKAKAERAMDAAACIGCGACVAACPNASASLFTGAKIMHLGEVPQGEPERHRRVLAMADAAAEAGFGHCANVGECEVVCPKGIGIGAIARMNRDFIAARLSVPSGK